MKKITGIFLSLAFLLSTGGCNAENPSPAAASGQDTEFQSGVFNIESVRKNILLKGNSFEIPIPLKDLKDGWSYKLYDDKDIYLADGNGLATIYYNDEEMVIAATENAYIGKRDDGIIYNLTIYDSDCSIDGLIPTVSTKQDVEEKYGEPIEISSNGSYSYGLIEKSTTRGRLNEQSICIKFDDDIISSISVTYADLSRSE